MEKLFNTIFKSLLKDLSNSQKESGENVPEGILPPLSAEGTVCLDYTLRLDSDGDILFAEKENGDGKNVHVDFQFLDPDVEYTFTVTSDAGGGGHWEHVTCGQHLIFDIKTHSIRETIMTVYIHANAKNILARLNAKCSF